MCSLDICHSLFLVIFNRWLNPLFKIGHKRRLEEDDMYSVLPEDRSQHLGEELQGWAQAAGRRGGRENFHVGLKVWGGALCLPLGPSEPLLLTLHAHPLRLTLGLAHFGGLTPVRQPCGCGGSPQSWHCRPISVPGGGTPGGGCLPS